MPYFSPAAPDRLTIYITNSPERTSAIKAVQPLTPKEIKSEATNEYPKRDCTSFAQTLKIPNHPHVFSSLVTGRNASCELVTCTFVSVESCIFSPFKKLTCPETGVSVIVPHEMPITECLPERIYYSYECVSSCYVFPAIPRLGSQIEIYQGLKIGEQHGQLGRRCNPSNQR